MSPSKTSRPVATRRASRRFARSGSAENSPRAATSSAVAAANTAAVINSPPPPTEMPVRASNPTNIRKMATLMRQAAFFRRRTPTDSRMNSRPYGRLGNQPK